MFKKMMCIALLLAAFSGTAFAAGETDIDAAYDQSIQEISDALPDSVAKYLDDGDTRQEAGVINGFLGVLNGIFGDFTSLLKDPLKLFGMTCAVLVICTAAGLYAKPEKKLTSDSTVSLIGSLAISGAVSTVVLTAVNSAITSVELAEQFVTGFIPVFAGILVSSGQITSAAMFSAGILAATGAASSIITLFVKPLTGVMLGLALVSGAYDNGMLSVVTGIKKTVMWVIGAITTLFVGLMGLQSMVSGQTDNMALRTTKYLVGSSVPIIGSAVSEAVATVSGSFKVIRATVGSAGIIALCGIFLPELIKLILCSVALSLSATVGDVIGVKNLSNSVRAVKGAIDIVTAMLSFYFIALAVCVAIMINAGS